MKEKNVSKIVLLCGLAVGLAALWAGATPQTIISPFVIGSDFSLVPCHETKSCTHTTMAECSDFEYWGYGGCQGNAIGCVYIYPRKDGRCKCSGKNPPCYTPGNPFCDTLYNARCIIR